MDNKNVQINIMIPKEWKEQLLKIARIRSVERDETISYTTLVKQEVKKIIELSGSL